MKTESSKPVTRSLALGLTLVGLHAGAAHAQRASILLGVGAGATPDLGNRAPGRSNLAMQAAGGVRVRAGRRLFADVVVAQQGEVATGDEVLIVPAPGSVYERYGPGIERKTAVLATEARVGLEGHPAGGPRLRASVGGGYLWDVDEPFVGAQAGLGTSGRRVRLTIDLEHRRFRLPVQELHVAPTGNYTTTVTRRYRAGASSTFLRLGAEVPVWR